MAGADEVGARRLILSTVKFLLLVTEKYLLNVLIYEDIGYPKVVDTSVHHASVLSTFTC